jgi:hypothetical protein
LATLLSPLRSDYSVSALDSNVGFTPDEIHRLIGRDGEAFWLQTGELLLVDWLACRARPEEKNIGATSLLRGAIGDPGGEVCGCALLLNPEETGRFSRSAKGALSLDSAAHSQTVLLLDDDEEVRPVIALGFERHNCRVVQARTAAESLTFCRGHAIDLLVADVSSLRPLPLETRRSLEEALMQAAMLLISGYECSTIADWYPGLLTGIQFLQKPFAFGLLGPLLRQIGRKTRRPYQLVTGGNRDLGG